MNSKETAATPAAVFWDMKNCPVPLGVNPDDVPANIRSALRRHPLIGGDVTSFTAYGHFNRFPLHLRGAWELARVKPIDLPSFHPDAAVKSILVDLSLFALDHSLPSSIIVISSDSHLAHALQLLGERGYTVILMVPPKTKVSSMFRKSGDILLDWLCVARAGTIVSADNGGLTPREESEILLVKDKDFQELKKQTVMLLKWAGGSVPLAAFSSGYAMMYGRQFCLAEYGFKKLAKLLDKFRDVVTVTGEGECRTIVLNKEEGEMAGISCLADRATENFAAVKEARTEMVVLNEENEKENSNPNARVGNRSAEIEEGEIPSAQSGDLQVLKMELVKLLKTAAGSLYVRDFEINYKAFYGRELRLTEYGFTGVGELLEKIPDIVTVIREEKCDGLAVLKGFEEAPITSTRRKRLRSVAKNTGKAPAVLRG